MSRLIRRSYTVNFSNPSETPAGQIRIVSQLDADLDWRSLRLTDLGIGDTNVHLPGDRASFQGDFDFIGSKGFVLRVSAGVDASTGIAIWLLQAIDPDTGEVMHDATRGLLAKNDSGNTERQKTGFSGEATDIHRAGPSSTFRMERQRTEVFRWPDNCSQYLTPTTR